MNLSRPLRDYEKKYLISIIGALILILVNLVCSYRYGEQIMIGFNIDTDYRDRGVHVLAVMAASPASRGGLHDQDIITQVNGITLENWHSYNEVIAKLSLNRTIKLTVLRSNISQDLYIFPQRRLTHTRFLAGLFLVMIYLAVGLLCYLKSPEDRRAQIALLCFLTIAVYNSQLNEFSSSDSIVDQILSLSNIIMRALSLMLIAIVPLYIPAQKKMLERSSAILILVAAPAFMLGLFSIANYYIQLYELPYQVIDDQWITWFDIQLLNILFIYFPVMMLHTYRHAESMTIRRQAKTMMYGVTCWSAINTIMLFASVNLRDSMLADPFYAQAIDVLLPITIFFTVYRHKLFDIDVLIRKSIVYTVVSGTLLISYFILVATTSWLLASVFNYENSVIAVAFSTMMVGFGFTPVRRYSQKLVNRMFFRDKDNYLDLINQLLLELTATLDIGRIAESLADSLHQGMKLKQVKILIPDEQQYFYIRSQRGVDLENSKEQAVILRGSDKLTSWLSTHRTLLPAYRIPKLDASIEEQRAIAQLNGELYVPIALRQLDAVIVLGEKQSEAGFDEEDYQFLNTVAHQAAIVMENARLFELATYDGLTALMRRNAFDGVFSDEIRRCRRYNRSLSLLMIDIDHFKKINDNYGHPFGDLVLKRVAATLKEHLRNTDTPARYGGEEFCILLAETELSAALKVAENLRAKLEKLTISNNEHSIKVTASFGVYSGTGKELPEESAIYQRADNALYRSKEQGRNRVTAAANEAVKL